MEFYCFFFLSTEEVSIVYNALEEIQSLFKQPLIRGYKFHTWSTQFGMVPT